MAEEAVGRAIAAVGRAMADEAEICPQIIEDLVFPEPSHSLYSSEDRRLIAASIFARGHAANNAGATKDAAVLFREASAVEPEKNTALISYLNMRLKMGDYGVCVAAYLRVLEGRSLNDKEMKHVRQKLHDANRLMALTPAERDAATRITRMARGANARRAFATRHSRSGSAGSAGSDGATIGTRYSHVAGVGDDPDSSSHRARKATSASANRRLGSRASADITAGWTFAPCAAWYASNVRRHPASRCVCGTRCTHGDARVQSASVDAPQASYARCDDGG